ncbi:MAG: acyclic terpene utilization AtuA family protein [Vicinamibacterales bacterium]
MTRPALVRLGGASAMWGDSAIATPQLLEVPGLDYLVYDYLAETTMSILARAKAKSPSAGYATDFVSGVMADHLEAITERGVRVLSNAGGMSPFACRDALAAVAAQKGLRPQIAVVTGDDVLAQVDSLRAAGVRDLAGHPLPSQLLSAHAYLGARAVERALAEGADIVLTGRVVDSAFVVGALVHEFGWAWDDWDLLAQATLAAHIIECGAQGSGGLFTDWDRVPDWDNIGYPVIECTPDGAVEVTKPAGTGGLVSPATVAEQMLYEIGDPAAYVMPDVVVDLRQARVHRTGPDRVAVSGSTGTRPPSTYKVSGTWHDGYRVDVLLAIRGRDAQAKAAKTAEALLRRTRRQMTERGFGDYTETLVEYLGAESHYGPHARPSGTREIVLRLAATHPSRDALEHLRREAASTGTSMGPGTRGHFGGRAEIQPVVRLTSFAIDRSRVPVAVDIGGRTAAVEDAGPTGTPPVAQRSTPAVAERSERRECDAASLTPEASGALETVPLVRLAHARSGDKGDTCNIGVVARTDAVWPWLRATLTAACVGAHMAHLATGPVERFELPGLLALNFVLHGALGGGGMASLRSDPLGKSFAQILLDMPVIVPASLLETIDGLN